VSLANYIRVSTRLGRTIHLARRPPDHSRNGQAKLLCGRWVDRASVSLELLPLCASCRARAIAAAEGRG